MRLSVRILLPREDLSGSLARGHPGRSSFDSTNAWILAAAVAGSRVLRPGWPRANGVAALPRQVHSWLHSMAHIHEKIDFTVAIFVVQNGRVLLVHHRKLDRWLPLGGHIELDEEPEIAALREAKEESGLDVELIGERPPFNSPGTQPLIAPRFLDIHRITDTHEHIGLIYWARAKGGTLALAAAEHHDIRWCSPDDLEALRPQISEAVKWYSRKAMEEVG